MTWPLATCATAAAIGIALGTVLAPGLPWLGALALVGALAALGAALAVRPVLVPLALAAALAGLARSEVPAGDPTERLRAEDAAGVQVVIEGRVADDPRAVANGFQVLVEPSRVTVASGRLASIGNILVRPRGTSEPAIDDVVQASGRLRLPIDLPTFDRRAYLAQKHAYLELVQASLLVITPAGGIRGLPGRIRASYRQALGDLLPAPHAAVLVAIVLGIRTGIPPRLNQDLIATGLVHLLVLSGLKVAVFARLTQALLRPLLGRLATVPTLGLIAVYALVGGATPAALRAAAMGGLALLATDLGRPSHVWTSLALVGAVMLGSQPELTWDVGFQLSFIGTAAILLLSPSIERRLKWLPGWLREPFAVTCAAQIGTLPLGATDFHLISPIAPVANALVLPILPFMVAAGLLIAPVAAIPDVGRILALPVVGLLAYIEQIAALLAAVPAAALPVTRFPVSLGAAYYSGLAGLLAWFRGSGRWRRAGLALAVAGPLTIGTFEVAAWTRAPASVTILAVGDGQAVLLRGPNGSVLIDGGPSPARLADELGPRLPPWDQHLEGLALTGSGLGHVGGLAGFEHPAQQVMLPAAALSGSAWRSVVLAETARGAGLVKLRAGQRFRLAGLDFTVLAPAVPADAGLGLQVRGPDGQTFCDLGDLSLESQTAAARHLAGRCDYLLLPGGGRSAPSAPFLVAARPGRMIASLASGRLARGLPATVLRTDQEGSVELPL